MNEEKQKERTQRIEAVLCDCRKMEGTNSNIVQVEAASRRRAEISAHVEAALRAKEEKLLHDRQLDQILKRSAYRTITVEATVV